MVEEDQDEWMSYATAGYGGAVDPWDDLVPVESDEEEDEIVEDEDMYDDELPSLRDLDAPPCPALPPLPPLPDILLLLLILRYTFESDEKLPKLTLC